MVGVAESLLVLIALLAVLIGGFAVRRRVLQRRYPSFEASLRCLPAPAGRGWRLGLGCYDGDRLRWYRLFSFDMRPALLLDRRTLESTGSRCPRGAEARALLTGHVVLEVADRGRRVELGIADAARTHLTAWVESAERTGERSLRSAPPDAGPDPAQTGSARPPAPAQAPPRPRSATH